MKLPPVQAETGTTAGGPSIELTAHDIIAGHGSAVYGMIVGFIAGLLLWIPVFVILYFNRFILIITGAPIPIGSRILDPVTLVPYILATGALGVGLAYLRRASARIGWYKEFLGQRLGLNGVVATLAGTLICLGVIATGNGAGLLLIFLSIGVLLGGFIVNGAWEAIHNRLLVFQGASQSDAILQRAVRHELERSQYFKPTSIENLRVERGKVILKATWADSESREEAEQALRSMPGATMVQWQRHE